MICPSCSHLNLPGSDECARCHLDLAALDLPAAQDRVEASVMSDRVSLLGSKTPVSISVHSTLGDALELMADAEIGALMVVDDRNSLVGILTERDYLMKVVGLMPDFRRQPLQPIMTPNPETVSADDSLAYALQKMDIGGYRHLPVVDQGRPVGIISVRDIIRHVTRLCRDA